jgi:WD40 repeat protein
MSNNKKMENWLFFVAVFAVPIFLMLISHIRSNYMQELKSYKDGIVKLYTVGNHLAAISGTKEIYLWDWNNLDQLPQKSTVNAEKILCLDEKRIIWIPTGGSQKVVISSFAGDKIYETLSLDYDEQCEHMNISGNGKFVVFLVSNKTVADDSEQLQLRVLTVDSYNFSQISGVNIDGTEIKIYDAVISDDGRLIGLVGSEKNAGWICLVDTQAEKILWQKQVDWSNLLAEAAFSSEGNKIYCAGNGIQVSCYNNNGQIIGGWKRDDYKIPANKTKSMSTLAISRNGKLLAAASNPSASVWMWNTTVKNFKPFVIKADNTYVTSIAFSPKTDMLVTASFKVIDKTHVWKLPKDISN